MCSKTRNIAIQLVLQQVKINHKSALRRRASLTSSFFFYFAHQVTSGYSISLIRDLARGTSQFYLRVACVAWTSTSSNSAATEYHK